MEIVITFVSFVSARWVVLFTLAIFGIFVLAVSGSLPPNSLGTCKEKSILWLREDSQLLDHADIVVSKNGHSGYTSIAAAVDAAPNHSKSQFIIYITAGHYNENIVVGKNKRNLMFIGAGKTETIISGSLSVADNIALPFTATFRTVGTSVVISDLTIENLAGPKKQQAVALSVEGDKTVVYRCNISGYQDTLYMVKGRQFFRECDVYGTVDFLFGQAKAVLQKCTIWARRPLPGQQNVITAQGRNSRSDTSGISFHACILVAAPELEAVKESIPTYLGRPWKPYSRVVYLMSYMGDHIHPAGWLAWNNSTNVYNLYYGEYMNRGPGSWLGMRVKWGSFRIITTLEEANKFSVKEFINGTDWLPSIGVPFEVDLLDGPF